MLAKVFTFQNTGWGVEETVSPADGEPGRCLILVDRDTGEVYRYPVSIPTAKEIGTAMLGIGQIEVPNGRVDINQIAQQTAEAERKAKG